MVWKGFEVCIYIYNPGGHMCAHMIWDISKYRKVSEVTSLLKEFVYVREFICLQMNPFYYHPRTWWKQIVPRFETNKRSALINFSGPLAQLFCLCDVWPTRLRPSLQIILFLITQATQSMGWVYFPKDIRLLVLPPNQTSQCRKKFLWTLSLFTQHALQMCLRYKRLLNKYYLFETAETSK